MAIVVASGGHAQGCGTGRITDPAETACLIEQLRTAEITLTYDLDTRTIRVGGNNAVAVTAGCNC